MASLPRWFIVSDRSDTALADPSAFDLESLPLSQVPVSSGMTLPPLECLFTVEEEIGLLGAFSLDASKIKGRTMLNLVSHWSLLCRVCKMT